jgi:hypothetical protein
LILFVVIVVVVYPGSPGRVRVRVLPRCEKQ